jgi:hypothetical protein
MRMKLALASPLAHRPRLVLLYTIKNGKPIFLPIPDFLEEALDSLPSPKGIQGTSKYFFWSGNDTTRDPLRRDVGNGPRVPAFRREGCSCAPLSAYFINCAVEKRWTTEDSHWSSAARPISSDDTIGNGLFSVRTAFRAWRKMCGMSDFVRLEKVARNW